jgi:hypothetical protein
VGAFARACFSAKAPGDLKDDNEVEAMLARDAGVAGNEGVVGESVSNSPEVQVFQSLLWVRFLK